MIAWVKEIDAFNLTITSWTVGAEYSQIGAVNSNAL